MSATTIERDSDARRNRGEVSLGDAITAVARLGAVSPQDVEAVIDALGLAVAPVVADDTTTAETTEPGEVTNAGEPTRSPPDGTSTAVEPAHVASPVAARLSHEDELDEPDWLEDVDALQFGVRRLAPAVPDPPLDPIRARAAMTLVAATRRAGRRLDIARLIERAARSQPQIPPPFVQELRTAPSVQLLVDAGEAMEPYVSDTEFLAEAFADVAGSDRIDEHAFIGTPLRGVDPDPFDGTTTPWEPPAPRSLVLVISDLGVGGRPAGRERGSAHEWERFASTVAEHEAVLRVLTPFAERRPARLDAAAQVIAWEEAVELVSIRA
jgi:hypothetical protein